MSNHSVKPHVLSNPPTAAISNHIPMDRSLAGRAFSKWQGGQIRFSKPDKLTEPGGLSKTKITPVETQ